jgi:hypothetical protein
MDVSRESMLHLSRNCLIDSPAPKHSLALPPPEQDHLLAIFASKSYCGVGAGAEDRPAVVIGQLGRTWLRTGGGPLSPDAALPWRRARLYLVAPV